MVPQESIILDYFHYLEERPVAEACCVQYTVADTLRIAHSTNHLILGGITSIRIESSS